MTNGASRWLGIAGVALLLAVFLATPARTQHPIKTDFSDTLTVGQALPGEGRLVARQDDGTTRTLVVDAQTQILDGDARVPLESLASGTRVTVDASFEGPGQSGPLRATRIVVVRTGG